MEEQIVNSLSVGKGEKTAILDKKASRKAVIAAAIGNTLEWYDMAIYAYFAPVFSGLIFPNSDPVASLLLTFAVFALGFVVRPLGGFLFGPYGDKYGRKKALSLAIILMGVSTFLIGVLPTYGQIGMAAPILLVLFRMAQGFSAGGEWGSNTSFIVEYAPEGKRGFFGSWTQVSTAGGSLLGALVAFAVTSLFPEEAVNAWAWRIPFILGIVISIFGYYLRTKLDETPKFKELSKKEVHSKTPLKDLFKYHKKDLFIIFGFTVHWTSSYYLLLNYMPTYVKTVMKIPYNVALLINVIVLAFFILIVPLIGALSDKIGRKPILIVSAFGFIVFSYPLFTLMADAGLFLIIVCQLILALFLACFSGPGPAAIAELTSTRVRSSALSIGYNTATAAFGGTAPFIATYLISITGNNFSPTFYVIGCAAITLVVLFLLRDPFKEPLK
jgi:MFS transporter, MHS family, proline/betaine transporter